MTDRQARMRARLDRYNPHLAFHLARTLVELQEAIQAAADSRHGEQPMEIGTS